MNTLNFSKNWNNKLDCKVFTTLRLHNPNKYFIGAKFHVNLKDKHHKDAEVVCVKSITIDKITSFIAGLDTGYSVGECKNVLLRMYKNADWSTQKLDFVLLKTL